ncbi:MAG: site-specific integrase [Candidatus Omnitrophica bacterium]|nr:site-specific integrase [Candidatus Omnitrophota bacterium]
MAKVFKRGNKWGIDFSCNGRRIREVVAPNKAIAETILKKRLVDIAENKFLDIRNHSKVNFKDFSAEYIDLHLKPNRPTWGKSEKHNMEHLNEYFGDRFLHEIKVIDVERLKIDHLKKVSKSSVNKVLCTLKTMFNKAIEWEKYNGINPVAKVKFYKLNNQRTRYLEKEEIKRLLEQCEGYLKDIVEFALNTGMRKGEIFNLKWHDVDVNRGIIFLLRTKNNEMREIPMNETVKSILFRVRKMPDSPFIFVGKTGNAFVDIKKSFYSALESAEITNFRFHDLRHTFASQLVMAGIDLNTVRELLGHKDIKMTLRYAHLSCYHKTLAVNCLDQLNGTKLAQTNAPDALSEMITVG